MQFTQVVDVVQAVKMTNAQGEVKCPIQVGSTIPLISILFMDKRCQF